jgi:hypothetical protein
LPACVADKNYCAGPESRTNPVFSQQFLRKTSRLPHHPSTTFPCKADWNMTKISFIRVRKETSCRRFFSALFCYPKR